jgi:enamine deaminase RidA (YjgF/YER057c/UK114 family)
MRHNNKHGIACSVFPFGHSRQMFLVGEPEEHYTCQNDIQGQGQTVPDYPRQIRSLLERCRTAFQESGFTKNTAVMCHVFLADIGMQELVRQLAWEIFPQILGAVTIVPQAPASGAVVALELWAVGGKKPRVVCEVQGDSLAGCATTVEFDGMRWFFGGNFRSFTEHIGAYNRSICAFRWLGSWLQRTKFRLDQVLRTWIYQGHLVLPEGKTQRYKELNRARTDFFGDTKFLKKYLPKKFKGAVYPASTGIGADDYDVVISAIALDTKRKDVIVVPLENPNQTSAFDYGAAYSPQSPKFSRAMAVAADETCLVFVSGTASITDSESQHHEDPVKQTEQTLDNIAALIDGENLARHGISDIACGLDKLVSVRVYVKRPSELQLVRQVCERRLPDVPTLYTVADVCRPELLVEIEGVVVAQKSH